MCFHHRYFNVVYNAEAVDIEKRYSGIPSDRGSDTRFFMHPVVFDVEVTRRLPHKNSPCLPSVIRFRLYDPLRHFSEF